MVQLKFVSVDGQPIGVINWYAVHLTSMNKTNQYISSDNKGYAGLLFEGAVNGAENMPGKVRFPIFYSTSTIRNSRTVNRVRLWQRSPVRILEMCPQTRWEPGALILDFHVIS